MSFQNPLPPGIRQVVPDYVSDGSTLVYGFPFELFAAGDLFVGVAAPGAPHGPSFEQFTRLNLNSDYTVAINGLTSATVTLAAAQPANTIIRILGLRAPYRTTSVVNDGVLLGAPFELELDVVEATLQEVRRDANAGLAAIVTETLRAEAAEAAEVVRATAAEAALSTSIAAEATRAEQAEAALAAWMTSAYVLTLDAYIEPGDPDATNAFARGHAINLALRGTPGKIYTVNGVVLNGKHFDGQGCVIRDAAGAPFCFRLEGWNPQLVNVQFQDQGNCAKATTNVGGFASGAGSIALAAATGVQAGQAVLIQGNGTNWETTQISALAGSTATLAAATSEAGSAGLAVVASFGLVHLSDSNHAVIDNLLMVNVGVGLVMSTSSAAGAQVSQPFINRIKVVSCRYAAGIKQGNVHDITFGTFVGFCGVVDTFNYVGAGVAGSFGVGYAVDLTRDLTVTVNGVAQVYGTDFELASSYAITFLTGSYPPVGAAIAIQHNHCSVRGWVEDQRNTFVSGGNVMRDFKLLGCLVAMDLVGVGLSDYVDINLDTNQYIGLQLSDCTFDLNFDQLSSTWARRPIVVFNSGSVKFGSLETDITPSGYLNPFIAAGAWEIDADASSYIDVDLSNWESPTYTHNPPGNVKLLGGRKLMFGSVNQLAAGSSTYLTPQGEVATIYPPVDIPERNTFLVEAELAVNVHPGGSETVTLNVLGNADTGSPVTIAAPQIVGSSFGGLVSLTPVAVAQGQRINLQAVYSAAASASYVRGYLLFR